MANDDGHRLSSIPGEDVVHNEEQHHGSIRSTQSPSGDGSEKISRLNRVLKIPLLLFVHRRGDVRQKHLQDGCHDIYDVRQRDADRHLAVEAEVVPQAGDGDGADP